MRPHSSPTAGPAGLPAGRRSRRLRSARQPAGTGVLQCAAVLLAALAAGRAQTPGYPACLPARRPALDACHPPYIMVPMPAASCAVTWYASVLLASLHEWNGVRYVRYRDVAFSISGESAILFSRLSSSPQPDRRRPRLHQRFSRHESTQQCSALPAHEGRLTPRGPRCIPITFQKAPAALFPSLRRQVGQLRSGVLPADCFAGQQHHAGHLCRHHNEGRRRWWCGCVGSACGCG